MTPRMLGCAVCSNSVLACYMCTATLRISPKVAVLNYHCTVLLFSGRGFVSIDFFVVSFFFIIGCPNQPRACSAHEFTRLSEAIIIRASPTERIWLVGWLIDSSIDRMVHRLLAAGDETASEMKKLHNRGPCVRVARPTYRSVVPVFSGPSAKKYGKHARHRLRPECWSLKTPGGFHSPWQHGVACLAHICVSPS